MYAIKTSLFSNRKGGDLSAENTNKKARVLLLTVIKMKGSGSCEMKEKGFIFPQTDFRSLIL